MKLDLNLKRITSSSCFVNTHFFSLIVKQEILFIYIMLKRVPETYQYLAVKCITIESRLFFAIFAQQFVSYVGIRQGYAKLQIKPGFRTSK